MGYTYILRVKEDLERLAVPEPVRAALERAWVEQGGAGEPPAELVPHIRNALRREWLAVHRAERLGELDAATRWAGENLGWRPLLEDPRLTALLAELGYRSLHRLFYDEGDASWFDASQACEVIERIVAAPAFGALDEPVRREVAALERALRNLARYGLEFRFEFCP